MDDRVVSQVLCKADAVEAVVVVVVSVAAATRKVVLMAAQSPEIEDALARGQQLANEGENVDAIEGVVVGKDMQSVVIAVQLVYFLQRQLVARLYLSLKTNSS